LRAAAGLDYKDTDPTRGVGAGVTLAESWHLRLEVQSLGIDREVLNARDDTSLDSLLFEVQYRFGARRPAARPAAPATATPLES
jgi:hypothetical protein